MFYPYFALYITVFRIIIAKLSLKKLKAIPNFLLDSSSPSYDPAKTTFNQVNKCNIL